MKINIKTLLRLLIDLFSVDRLILSQTKKEISIKTDKSKNTYLKYRIKKHSFQFHIWIHPGGYPENNAATMMLGIVADH